MDIDGQILTLKAIAYDTAVQIDVLRAKLNQLNNQIAQSIELKQKEDQSPKDKEIKSEEVK